MFRYIDMENWDRREYYEHYMHAVRCSYSMTVNLDITELLAAIKGKVSLYPVMIYFLSVLVNRHEEFRYAVKAGRVGVYDALHPSYTIFYKESETFSCIWTRFEEEFAAFYRAYLCDKEAYGQAAGLVPKPDCPENSFNISCIPWTSFGGFNLNVYDDGTYLAPIFTIGKYITQGGAVLLPLALQLHHAVCDGFHACRLINELQGLCQNTKELHI